MEMNSKRDTAGFTLIEMIVSLGIFAIVVTTAVGAMLMLISNNQRLQAEQSVMTNLSFALDTMTREIRTGFNYYCDEELSLSSGGTNNIFSYNQESIISGPPTGETRDCPSGRTTGSLTAVQGISFFEGGDSLTGSTGNRILYYYDRDAKTIMRRLSNETAQSIVSSGLDIVDAQFTVTGSTPLSEGGSNT
jgi:prepilin-type N-terminal cleavage/methylation domain-containing protein